MQEKVNKWLEAGCNYNEGVSLLASLPNNKQLVKVISGRPHRYTDKLRYELLKAAGLNTLMPNHNATSAKVPAAEVYSPVSSQELQNEKPIKKDQLPPEVEHVIKLHADAYKTRAILHDAMAQLPSENTDKLIIKRKELSDQIAECSVIIDAMYKAKEDYYTNGTIPDIKALTALKPEENKAAELPSDVDSLKDLKKNLQTNICKNQFLLDYQQNKKGKNPNPLPIGPKRTKIELKIKSFTETLELIEIKLKELA